MHTWVAIGLAGETTLPEKFRTPVLDLHGKKDRPGVLDGAAQRAATLRRVRSSGQVQLRVPTTFSPGWKASSCGG